MDKSEKLSAIEMSQNNVSPVVRYIPNDPRFSALLGGVIRESFNILGYMVGFADVVLSCGVFYQNAASSNNTLHGLKVTINRTGQFGSPTKYCFKISLDIII